VQQAPDGRFFLQTPENVLLEWAVHPLSIVRRLLGKLKQASSLVTAEKYTATGRPFYSSWQSSLECERGTAQLMLSVGEGYDCCWMDVLGEDALAHVDILGDSMVLSEYTPYRPALAGFRNTWANAGLLLSSAGDNAADYIRSGFGRPVPGSPSNAGMHYSLKSFYEALARGAEPPESLEQGTAVVQYCEGIFASAFGAARGGAV
jgi:predicted dehydrogenase